jgi:SAM-dependent methyltransferase
MVVELLPVDKLVRTGPVDFAVWNYGGVLGWISRSRFRLVMKLLPTERVDRLLEIGYGSGVFMGQLARHCRELHGIDIHPHADTVRSKLDEVGIAAQTVQGSAERMPYPDGHFDCIVAVSALEFVEDIESAAREILRVLKPGGRLVLVTPGHSPVVDAGLYLLTRRSASEDYGGKRERLRRALDACLDVDREIGFPPGLGRWLRLYTALRMKPRAPGRG